jgi:hypothetical protein
LAVVAGVAVRLRSGDRELQLVDLAPQPLKNGRQRRGCGQDLMIDITNVISSSVIAM